jgi:lysophospholipase L1-like esterase
MKRYFIAIIIFQFFIGATFAQIQPRFWDNVQTIKKYDQMYAPPAHPVLFVGSSSIRKWDDAERAFADYKVLNRGIGGALINDINFYLDAIVFNYEPSQIVLYVGENDLIDATETADTILNRTVILYQNIRKKLPEVPIVYIAMKPSPSRDKFAQKAVAANTLIKQFLAPQKNTVFVDIYPLMLRDGKSRPELFGEDMLHMNKQGYAIWKKAVRPYLIRR